MMNLKKIIIIDRKLQTFNSSTEMTPGPISVTAFFISASPQFLGTLPMNNRCFAWDAEHFTFFPWQRKRVLAEKLILWEVESKTRQQLVKNSPKSTSKHTKIKYNKKIECMMVVHLQISGTHRAKFWFNKPWMGQFKGENHQQEVHLNYL